MLLTIGAVVLVIAAVGVVRVSWRVSPPNHGWMSERWLAEHRSTPPS